MITSVLALADGGALEATLGKIDVGAATLTSLSADLRRVHHTAVINDDTFDEGVYLMKRPKPHETRLLFNVKQPDPKQDAFDGRKVQMYYPKSQVCQEIDVTRYRDLADQYLLLGFGSNSKELQSAYSITLGGPETIGNEKTTRLELVPKSQELLAHLKKVELWISDANGLPVQQKFYQPGGDYDVATYSNVKLNPNLPDSAFKLELPKGVKCEHPAK